MIVGLTGGIGSGKSVAGDFFIELGIDLIDADMISKDILDNNLKAKELFTENFGELEMLESLEMYYHDLIVFPLSFPQLENLKAINMKGNKLKIENQKLNNQKAKSDHLLQRNFLNTMVKL